MERWEENSLRSPFRYGIAGGETLKQDHARFFGQSKESRRPLGDKISERKEVVLDMPDIDPGKVRNGRNEK